MNNYNIEDKIKFAKSMIENNIVQFKQFNYLYPFTTENINAYLDCFDLSNRSLLTVGSSADQVLNAIICGCKNITLYDICPFTREYYYLKISAIKVLNREEYLKFFCYLNYPMWLFKNINTFDNRVYVKIAEYLKNIDDDSYYFWNELFNNYKDKTIRKKIFNKDEVNLKTNLSVNRYLFSDDTYNLLSKLIDKTSVEIVNGDIFNIDTYKKYDNIFLSNILAYCNLDKFVGLIYRIVELLNDDGKMLVSYLYDTDCHDICIDDIDGRYSKDDILKAIDLPLDFMSFKGNSGITVNDNRMTDSIITYTKVKKI